MISRAALIAQLQSEIPTLGDIPSAAQAGQAIDDAVRDLGVALPQTIVTTLTIEAGIGSYALPADFVRLIDLRSPATAGGDMLITDDGIIPLSSRISEQVTTARGQLTISPTPAYRAERALWYAASDPLDGDGDTFSTLDASRAQIALHRARAIVLGWQAARAAQDAWLSELGPEKVDKTKQAEALQKAAAAAATQFAHATRDAAGPYGSRS